jgi:chemotaxis protein CheZ
MMAPTSGMQMAVQRKVFRIEESGRSGARPVAEPPQHALTEEIKALRALIEPNAVVSREAMERSRAQIAEAQAYKRELDIIHAAIERTREPGGAEVVSSGSQLARVTEELCTVVAATEQATVSILKAVEDIDQMANSLSASVTNEHEQGLAQDIRERVVQILEACNFQDLTGQRVAKVGATLKFIEDHVTRLKAIWRELEQFEPVVLPEAGAAARLLSGPKLAGDPGHSSQREIDARFAHA